MVFSIFILPEKAYSQGFLSIFENSQNTTSTGIPSDSILGNNSYIFADTDIAKPVIYLINSDDKFIVKPIRDLWDGGNPLHVVITKDGKKAYVTTISSDKEPSLILVLKINRIDWNNKNTDLQVVDSIEIAKPKTSSSFPDITQVDIKQPVNKTLWFPDNSQIHGPTIHPSGKYIYFNEWTSDRIFKIDVKNDKLQIIKFPGFTEQLHGVFFNQDGTKALSPGYFFDLNYVVLYDVNPMTGELTNPTKLILGDNDKYAAFTHFVTWVNNTHALTSSQQLGPTSATPPTTNQIIGPSVWLIDTKNMTTKMIINTTSQPDGKGIFKPASDTAIIGQKLYVAEEDSMDDRVDNDGYVSVWDISKGIDSPQFIKRFSPGKELPKDFKFGHELYPTPDNKFIYVQSWISGRLVKITVSNDEVIKTLDGNTHKLVLPHGGFITGNLR